jgi:16S rRNA (guanine527-N7)-methyltransferase
MTAHPELPQAIDLWQTTLRWHPDDAQQAQFQRLYEFILEGNRQLNLTRITEPTEFWEKHLWDSLRAIADWQDSSDVSLSPSDAPIAQPDEASPPLNEASIAASPFLLGSSDIQVIDIGTGAGFPGIPVAIAQPHWHVTLLDSTRKKMVFVESLLAALPLTNATTVTARAESIKYHPQHRLHYDLALVRAVAEATVCAEYALPLLKLGGLAVLYRGQWTEAETETLEAAIAKLGGAIVHIAEFKTPFSESVRHCVYLRKIANTLKEFPKPKIS